MKDIKNFVQAENTFKRIRESMNKSLKPKMITFDQWIVMQEIFKKGGINQKQIANNTGKDEASVSRIISKLKKQNYIYSMKSPINKKFLNLHMTADGKNLSENVSILVNEKFDTVAKDIAEEEIYGFQNC